MTLNDFVMKYYKKNVRYNTSTQGTYQCVDLAKAWLIESGVMPGNFGWGNAKDWATNYDKSKVKFIKNEASTIPQAGDIAVWDGKYGHVAVVLFANVNRLITFDQNYNTKNEPCTFVYHTYKNCLGFIRRK